MSSLLTRGRAAVTVGRVLMLVLLVVAGSGPLAAQAADIYVDGSAPPGGDGSFDNPFNTIQAGIDAAGPGDTVWVRGGTYSEALHSVRNGTESAPITVRNYPGEEVWNKYNGRGLYINHDYIIVDGINIDGLWTTTNSIVRVGDDGQYVTIRNCEIRNAMNHMVHFVGDHILIENCNLHHAIRNATTDAHCLVTDDATYVTIRGCTIWMASGDCIQFEAASWHDMVIEDCDLYMLPMDIPRPGVSVGTYVTENLLDTKDPGSWNYNVTIRNCLLHGSIYSRTTLGGALNLKKLVRNFYIYNNIIYDNRLAFRLRQPSFNYHIYNNLIINNQTAVRFEDNISHLYFYNNTFYNNETPIDGGGGGAGADLVWKNNIFAESIAARDEGTAWENNLFWNVPSIIIKSGSGNIVGDPKFVDPADGDFHLQPDSPAIDAGQAIAEVADDYDGTPRPQGSAYDIGAYEFVPPAEPPRVTDVQPGIGVVHYSSQDLNQITITFDQDVAITAADVTVEGRTVGPRNDFAFSYDPETMTATLTWNTPLEDDTYILTVRDSVQNYDGVALDGEEDLENPSLPSGDGEPGGNFTAAIYRLVADVNGDRSVDLLDLLILANEWGQADGQADIDGNGSVDLLDLMILAEQFGKSIPAATD